MARFENSPGLFGVGSGGSTSGDLLCEWCGTEYHGVSDDEDGGEDFISHVKFGNLTVAECCFEKVERAVLFHMKDILPWFERILKHKEHQTDAFKNLIESLRGTLQK